MSEIKASVCIVTYNQSAYLKECLDSLVNQEVDFGYEIIVGDDASQDNTQEIMSGYVEKYPGLITYIRHKENIGPTANYKAVHARARGGYVFHMDGDDIAFPGKIRKQVELLEGRDDCVLCWHKVNVFSDDGSVKKVLHEKLGSVVDVNCITQGDLIKYGMLGAHSSTAYKKSAMPDFGSIKGEVLDYFMVCLILSSGNAVRIEEVLGGYRVNPNLTTASKKGSLYFKGSPIREIYARHLDFFSGDVKGNSYRGEVFLNAAFNFIVDIRFLRPSAFSFLGLMLKTVSVRGVFGFIRYFKECIEIRE